ncbi:hypothetical protein AB1Y20_015092 [Prymnesium parvum]|uniref:Uncharacterized protein n=1 Tax=Prymnesium parvum TaxID=97485 RepID=A0AB34JVQ9_PRYPA
MSATEATTSTNNFGSEQRRTKAEQIRLQALDLLVQDPFPSKPKDIMRLLRGHDEGAEQHPYAAVSVLHVLQESGM